MPERFASIPGLNPDCGLSLEDAVLFYGDLARPRLHHARKILFEMHMQRGEVAIEARFSREWLGEHYAEALAEYGADELAADYHRHEWAAEYLNEKGAAESVILAKLIAGELQATGFERGAPLDRPPATIHPERWRALHPNFLNSTSYGSANIVLIRIFAADRPLAAAAQKTARPAPGMEMLDAYEALLNEGQNFTTRKAAHRAVVDRIGEGLGRSYKTFCRLMQDRAEHVAQISSSQSSH